MKKMLVVLSVVALALVAVAAVPAADAGGASCSVSAGQTTWLPPGILVRPVSFTWTTPPPAPNQEVVVGAVIQDQTGAAHVYNWATGGVSPAFYTEKSMTAWASVWMKTCAAGTNGQFCTPGEQVATCSAVIPAP